MLLSSPSAHRASYSSALSSLSAATYCLVLPGIMSPVNLLIVAKLAFLVVSTARSDTQIYSRYLFLKPGKTELIRVFTSLQTESEFGISGSTLDES